MSYNEQLPEWNKQGAEPPQDKKDNGWEPSEKPPADWFNWLFNKIYKALQELQGKAESTDNKGQPEGYAGLDADGNVPVLQLGNAETPTGALEKAAAAYNGATDYTDIAIDNLAGDGRTTETVKGNADAIEAVQQQVMTHEAHYANHGNLKNKIINGSRVINQRNFNGNWSALSNGQYGFDRWKRVDASNMAQVIEAGNFKPNAVYTLSGTNVTTAQLTSPASGNWTITVPNTANNIQLEEGEYATSFEQRPIGLELMLCQRYYSIGEVQWFGVTNIGTGYRTNIVLYPVTMRIPPTMTVTEMEVAGFDTPTNSVLGKFGFFHRMVANSTSGGFRKSYTADAEL